MNKKLINIFITIVSLLFTLLLCEFGTRFFLDPVDYLSPIQVKDQVLGMKIPPRSGGHDAWGYRNRALLKSPDIVAIGDSHTYGHSAKMAESWPSVLARMTGKKVYNLGMGGYGPNQYFNLLETKAIGLKPKIIICGLYMGDDFDNAYEITYGLDYWKHLRTLALPSSDIWDIWKMGSTVSWHKKIRNWLSHHSILYRITAHGLFSTIKGNIQIKHASDLYEDTASLILKEKNIREAFRPKGVLLGLDQNKQSVREGMRITFQLIKEMNDKCRDIDIHFIVAIIPTKESVFSDYLEHNEFIKMYDVFEKLIFSENCAKSELINFFHSVGVRYVDLSGPMKLSVGNERIYTNSALDMHPNKNGYRVIAEALAANISAAR